LGVGQSQSHSQSDDHKSYQSHIKSIPWACMQIFEVTGGRLLQLLAATQVLQQGGSSGGDFAKHACYLLLVFSSA